MQPVINIKHGDEKLVSHSGLLSVGVLLEQMQLTSSLADIPGVYCVNPDISHADILSSMIGLICVGKPDYSAIEIFRQDPWFFTKALKILDIFGNNNYLSGSCCASGSYIFNLAITI